MSTSIRSIMDFQAFTFLTNIKKLMGKRLKLVLRKPLFSARSNQGIILRKNKSHILQDKRYNPKLIEKRWLELAYYTPKSVDGRLRLYLAV